jgi:hypothetical protein
MEETPIITAIGDVEPPGLPTMWGNVSCYYRVKTLACGNEIEIRISIDAVPEFLRKLKAALDTGETTRSRPLPERSGTRQFETL